MRMTRIRPHDVADIAATRTRELTRLSGSLVAVATPFRDGAVDLDAFAALCERQVARGSAALVVCGSTGEAASLSAAEPARIIATAVATARGRVPVIAGCTSACTVTSMDLAVAAAKSGADALLCAPPPYAKPTQDGIVAHLRAVAQAADLPLMAYDVPGRAGVAIADATIARLFERGAIFAVKDATADLSRPPRLRALCGEALLQFSGDDFTALAHRAMGGHGCVSVTANLVPALCAALQDAWDRGDMIRAASVRDLLAPLHEALFLESNPIPLKSALGMLRLCEGEVRLPLTRASVATRSRLASVMADLLRAEEDVSCSRRLAVVR